MEGRVQLIEGQELTEQHFGRVFLATLTVSALLLSACSSPVREPEAEATVVASAPVPAEAPPVDPRFAPPPAPAPEVTDAVPEAESHPVEYADLFDRVRAGFALPEEEDVAIDVQMAWYINHPDYMERTFARGERYLYHIVTELEARQMPLELALLPVVESAYEPFGYSRARASGLWQFIPATGKRFDLKQNWWYDGRRDLLESTRAALDYLQFLHTEFNGDWLLAIAAYNSGEVTVHRAVAENLRRNKPTDFWHLKLPKETRAYVPKLLAMRRIVAAPEAVGLEFSSIPNEPYFARVETGGQIDLRLAAELAGVDNEELAYLNPAFNRWATDPDGPYFLLLPVDTSEQFRGALGQLSREDRVPYTSYEVAAGENLTTFARRCGTTASVVREINNLSSTRIRKGQELLVPAIAGDLHPKMALAAARVDGRVPQTRGNFHIVRRGESLWSISRSTGINVSTLASLNGMAPDDVLSAGKKLRLRGANAAAATYANQVLTASGDALTYTVRRGDTLYDIARRFSVSVSQLLNWNGLSKRDALMPGQRLVMYPTARAKI
jgi:membrane-bound lytic murein transglycosylase D